MNKIYLAGPIFGRTDSDCKEWRTEATKLLGGRVLNPMHRDYRGVAYTPQVVADLVESDKRDIDQCAGVLVYFDKPSVGTSMEILYAFERRKSVVLVNLSGGELSPWILYHSTVVGNLAEACALFTCPARS